MKDELNDKSIWILHHYAAPPTMNGFIRPYEFGINLKKAGYKVKVFAASYLHSAEVNLIKNNDPYIINNETEIPFVFINTPSSESGIKRVWNMISYYKNVLRVTKGFLKKGEKPDLIIASSPHPLVMVAGLKIARKLGIPCICEVRDFWPEVFFTGGKIKEDSIIGKILVKGEHWIYKKADALIFLKEGDYKYITDKKWDTAQGGSVNLEKCYYINNGVNIEKFNYNRENEKPDDSDIEAEKFNVVYTGAIRLVNNVSNILDAAKLLKNHTNIQFLIYGEGNQVNFLKKRTTDEKITNVKMQGYTQKKYLPYVLSKSSVNILNYSQSKYNWSRGNSSNKLFDYLASGKPIISTVRMGYSPIERYECGVSLSENTAENLAAMILKIYEMPKDEYEKMGLNAKNAAKDFDYKVLTNKLIDVIKNVTEGSKYD